MKKVSLTLLAALVFAFSANAQLKNKQGETILPETGDWAIGIDAAPALIYFGNMFNNSAANTINWNFTNGNQQIFGKYFTSETEAYRIGLRLGFVSTTLKNTVGNDTDPAKFLEDKRTENNMNFMLSLGKEFRRGHGRLQGFYGADVYLMLGSTSRSFTYGNAFATTNTAPTFTDDWNFFTTATGTRSLKEKDGAMFGFGVRGFIGAEYFVLPKLSIGGEFGWGLGLNTQGKGKATIESWDFVAGSSKETEVETFSGSQFGIDTDNFGGAIKVMFHF